MDGVKEDMEMVGVSEEDAEKIRCDSWREEEGKKRE